MHQMEAAGINRRLDVNVTHSVKVRMEKYTSKQPDKNGCILWQGAQRNSYGAIKIENRVYGSHCVAFVMAGGVIEAGCVIAHKCDVKLCVNPAHLECVSVQKNNMDMQRRRPRPVACGEELPQSVLSEKIVVAIFSLYQPYRFGYRKIAQSLGVSEHAVKNVLFGPNWMQVKNKHNLKICS
jgi:hypothetical protein